MACVPPRAGFESARARKVPIAQGVPLSHCRMKQILVRSSLWHKTCRGWLPVLNVRNMTSQAVGIEEMGAIEGNEASEKKTVHRQRWQAHETMALIAAKKQQDLMGVESTEATGIESKKTKNNWKEIEAFCREKGIERSAQQCQTRWFRLMSAFTQIRSWEETRKPEQPSFWSLKLDERKTMGFLLSLDQKTYNALDELYNSKVDAIENVLVKDDDYAVVEVAKLGSVNNMPHGYDGEAHEIKNKTNSHTSSYKTDEMVHTEFLNISKPIGKENNERYVRDADDGFLMEELEDCRREKHVDQCIAMENTKILSEFLQKVMDDRNEAQVPHVSTGKTDLNPTVLHTGQHVESLKVSGLAAHSNPLILCNQEDVNAKAQLLPASAEVIDGSNKDSWEVPLVEVDDCNKAQLLHARAENVDYNATNLHTGQHAESLKYFGKGEHIISRSGCDQRDVYDKAELLPASAEMIDGSNKDSCKGSLEECGAEEKTIVMHGDDDNVPDEILQAAQDEGIEKGADGSFLEINASVTDSVVVEDIANANSVSASVKESCECQKSESHLSSTGVDALNASQSSQITGTACQNYFVDRILAEEAWIDKNEKGEGCEVNSFLVPKNAEDISIALADNLQSNFIEAQNSQMRDGVTAQLNNLDPVMEAAFVRSQMVLRTRFEQQQGDLNPLLAFKEEIGTGVLQQGPEVNSTFPTSENIESTCSDQDKEYEKFELCPSEEGHIEMIADMTQRNATKLECSTGHSFEEKKVENLQIGNNEYNKQITEPSQSIKHFEVAVKDMDMFAKREPCEQMQSDHEKDGSNINERMKVAIKEGDCVIGKIGIRASTMDTDPPSLTCIHNQFQHAPEQRSTIKGDSGIFKSVSEASRAEVAANEPKELEFIIKDDRTTSVTAGKGNIEDRSQKTSTSSPADEDVFMYVPAATGTFVKSALQSIRKFFKF